MLEFLDDRTLIFVSFAMIAIFTGIIVSQRRGMAAEAAAIHWFAAGCAVFGVGGLAMGLRGSIHPLVSLPLGNGMLCLGLALCWMGLSLFDQRRAHWGLAGTLAALAFVFALPQMPYRATVIVCSMTMALAAGAAAWTALRGGRRTSARVLIAIGFAGFGIATLSRALGAIVAPPLVPASQLIAADTPAVKLLLVVTTTVAEFWISGFLLLIGERLRERLEYFASHDALTQVYNRRAFLEIAEREIRQAERKGEAVAVVLADLDRFKQINDTFGHAAGDEVLRVFVTAVQTELRQGDWLARYGGEEFIMLLPSANAEQAGGVAERIRLRYAQSRGTPAMGDHPLSVSLGVADANAIGWHLENLLVASDRALYRAKRNGRGRVVVARAMGEFTLP